MPVRVKQRGFKFSDRGRVDKEWEILSKEIASLLLPWLSEVSISLRESNTKKEARFKIGSTDLVSRTERLFIQAGLAGSEDTGSWVPVSVSSRRVRIKGAISKNPVATRRSQIMSFGIRPIPNSFGTNILYEEVNKIFKNSNFGDAKDDTNDQRREGMKWKSRKNIERWPMFYMDISLFTAGESLAVDDVLGDSPQTLKAIIELLKVACYGFLKKHCFQPSHIQPMSCTQASSTASRGLRVQRSLLENLSSQAPGNPKPSCLILQAMIPKSAEPTALSMNGAM